MIKLEKISKSFPGIFEPALNNVDLHITPGEFCVIIGANGSGKSTLLKVISGEYAADSGKVTRKGTVCEVGQDVNKGTVSSLTLLENVALARMKKENPKFAFYKRFKGEIVEKIKDLGIGLEKSIDRPIGSLSGGQRQIIATLMAVNSGGQILTLDEHTSALDPKTQGMLMEYTVKSIVEKNLTALMITHKMDDAIKYGARLIMLHKGRLVADIKENEKRKLKIQDLLEMFHKYEDQDLSGEIK